MHNWAAHGAFYTNYREWTVNLFFNEWAARGVFYTNFREWAVNYLFNEWAARNAELQSFRGWQYVNERFIGKSNTLLYIRTTLKSS